MLYRNYRTISQLISKPFNYLFSWNSTQHDKQQKKKQYQNLTPLDLLIFKQAKPAHKFLESSYGVHARISHNNQLINTSTFNNSEDNYDNKSQQFDNLVLLPFLLIGTYQISQNDQTQCFIFGGSGSTRLKPNQVDKRTVILQYAANLPIEDRYKATQLQQISGYAISVFDGHGGWQVAELAMKMLHAEIDLALSQNANRYENQDDYVQYSLKQAHDRIEQEFYNVAIEAYKKGFASVARVGACALTALVVGDTLYSANLGDCKGIIVNLSGKQPTFRKINHMLNANSKKEQARLRILFSDEEDIVVCRKGSNRSCYVKNRLQPTRALGDFRLKFHEFNNPLNETKEKGFVDQIPNFRGPYIEVEKILLYVLIKSVPDQKKFKLEKGDRYLIMGSDGLWDELTKKDISQVIQNKVFDKIVKDNAGDSDKITKAIFEHSIIHAARDNNMSEEQIRNIPLGKRRKLHDDITVIVVDLENQF